MMVMFWYTAACASFIVLTNAVSDNQHSGHLEVGAGGQVFDMRSPLMRRGAAETNVESVTKSLEPNPNNSAVVNNLTASRPMTDNNLTASAPVPMTVKQLQDLVTAAGSMTAKQLQDLGPNNSAALFNSLKAELAKEKARGTRDEQMLANAVAKLSSGRPLANFIAGMDTGEIPKDGLSQEQLENMTADTEHAQFALRSTVNILSNTLSTLSSGKAMADAIFGSDTSDLARPRESATEAALPKDAFEAMDANDDGNIQRTEWDNAKQLRMAAESQYQSQQSQQANAMCSSDDLRQVFAAMSHTCQAAAGQKFISEIPGTSETKIKDLCPCILEAIPNLGQDFLRRDCMPTGTTPLSHLCSGAMETEAPIKEGQKAVPPEAPLQEAQKAAPELPKVKQEPPAAVPPPPKGPPKAAKPAAQAPPLQPSNFGGRPQDGMQPATAVLPDCKSDDLKSMFDTMDDKCQAAVGKQFLTSPLDPAPDEKKLCGCVDVAIKKLGVQDCVPPGVAGQHTGPSFRMICDNFSEDDTENQADDSSKVQDENVLNSFGAQLMKALPQWHA